MYAEEGKGYRSVADGRTASCTPARRSDAKSEGIAKRLTHESSVHQDAKICLAIQQRDKRLLAAFGFDVTCRAA